MARIRVRSFGGMIPALDSKLLPNENASNAVNCRLVDGKLRPFKKVSNPYNPPASVNMTRSEIGFDRIENVPFSGAYLSQYPTMFRVLNQNASKYDSVGYPFVTHPRIFGVAETVVRGIDFGGGPLRTLGVPSGPRILLKGITPQLRSKYPIARRYCATYVNQYGEEGPPGVISQDIYCFEGDTIDLLIRPTFNNFPDHFYALSKIRLYRTAAPYDNGEQMGNKNDTDFILVTELDYRYSPVGVDDQFIDTIPTSDIPGDLLLSKEFFHAPQLNAVAMAELESGYLAIATNDGAIRISERFQYHAFPLRNEITIPQQIASMVAYYDSLFVTCKNGSAYKIDIRPDATGITFDVNPYPDVYSSNEARSLVRSNFGAVFASQRGLVGLNAQQQVLLTRGLINPDVWNKQFSPIYGIWASGYYIGLGTPDNRHWLMDVPDDITGQTPFGKLVYLDQEIIPANPNLVIDPTMFSGIYGKDRVYFFQGGAVLFTWEGLEQPASEVDAARYIWRSKTFVMPAPTTFAAAKIGFKNKDGSAGPIPLTFKLYGDGVLKYERLVYSDKPFRLPHLYKSTNWEFELIGYSDVDEVHIATSMIELSDET